MERFNDCRVAVLRQILLYSILNIPDFPQESPAAIHLHIFLEKLESIALVGQVVIVLLDFSFQGLTNLLQYFRGDFPVFLLDHRFICVDPANPITGQQGVGIALIGNTEVYTRMVGKQEARFAQLFSRIRMNRYYSTRKVTEQDVAKLFPKLAEEGRKKELTFLHGISQSKWGIRGAVNVYNNAVNNEDISYDGLYAMARTMGIGLV